MLSNGKMIPMPWNYDLGQTYEMCLLEQRGFPNQKEFSPIHLFIGSMYLGRFFLSFYSYICQINIKIYTFQGCYED